MMMFMIYWSDDKCALTFFFLLASGLLRVNWFVFKTSPLKCVTVRVKPLFCWKTPVTKQPCSLCTKWSVTLVFWPLRFRLTGPEITAQSKFPAAHFFLSCHHRVKRSFWTCLKTNTGAWRSVPPPPGSLSYIICQVSFVYLSVCVDVAE